MKKKRVIIIGIVVVLLFIAAAVGAALLFQEGGYQQTELKGYGLALPERWEITAEDNTVYFAEKGEEKGSFSLLYQDCELLEIPGLFDFLGAEPVIRESDQYAAKVYELSFEAEGQQVLQYVFDALPDGPPYKLVLTLIDSDKKTTGRILSSITLPDISGFAPEKPLAVPEGEALEQAVYTIQNEYGCFTYNAAQLETWLKTEEASALPTLHVLTFTGESAERSVKSWYYLASDGTKQYLFTYYQGADGLYIYDNNPVEISGLEKEASAEENYTRYFAAGVQLLEQPYNQYAENKETLLQYKGTLIGDNSNVHQLVMEALPAGVVLEGISLQTSRAPYGLTVQYTLTKADQYITNGVLNESPFYQNGLVLLSLIDNVDQIRIEIKGNDKSYTVLSKRKVAEQQFENKDLREFTESEEGFSQFTEEIPKIEPPDDEGTGNKTEGTRAVKSVNVILSENSTVIHPETGKSVSVESYAKKYGLTKYLNRQITVTLYEKVSAGKTTLWAEGTCDGAAIGSYPIKSITEFDSMVASFSN